VLSAAMVESLRAAAEADLPNISRFLLKTYPAEASGAFAAADVLRWKYFEPRLNWTASRSYLLEKQGNIVAHGGLWPTQFRLPGGQSVSSVTILDWAGDPSVPAVGAMLMRKLMKMAETSYVIGGAPAARTILPKIGFRVLGEARTYARWIRPWKEFRTRPASLRSAMRLMHGVARVPFTPAPFSGSLESSPVQEFGPEVQPIICRQGAFSTSCRRTVEDLNHALRCPLIKMKGFLLTKNAGVHGYFVLALAGWEARLIDIQLDSEDPHDWKLAYAAAVKAVLGEPEICRLRALSALPLLNQALSQNGFWIQYREPIMMHDPKHLLAQAFPINFQLFEGDAGF
jgi:hypothetical protein